jgi:hypothetical protein
MKPQSQFDSLAMSEIRSFCLHPNFTARVSAPGYRELFKVCGSSGMRKQVPYTTTTGYENIVAEDDTMATGVRRLVIREPESVLKFQAMRGFAGVSESSLQSLLTDTLGKELPDEAVCQDDRKTTLALASMKVVFPDWKSCQATNALAIAASIECPNADAELPVHEDLISELVYAGERSEVQRHAAEIDVAQTGRSMRMGARHTRVSHFFKAKARVKGKAKPAPKWTAPPVEDVHDVSTHILKHIPNDARVYTDLTSGRWSIVNGDKSRKSVSWTRRGFSIAAAEAIYVAWQHKEFTSGVASPYKMEELVAQFEASIIV